MESENTDAQLEITLVNNENDSAGVIEDHGSEGRVSDNADTHESDQIQQHVAEKTAKAKQYKNFGYIAGGLVMAFVVMMAFRESKNPDNLKSSRYYKKEIKTGVDSLSDKEMWVERSTNEIEDIRNSAKRLESQNTLLQKQLESLKRLVIGVGVHMRAFDDQQEDKTDTIPSKDVPEYQKYRKENHHISKNEKESDAQTSVSTDSSSPMSFEKIENFVDQKGISDTGISNTSISDTSVTVASNTNTSNSSVLSNIPFIGSKNKHSVNQKVLKNGIKVVKFNNNDSEYDLDENFIFAGTYARAILVGTVIASAGIGASANPEPVLLRISDFGNLPNNVKGFLKDAIVVGAAYGDLSSESVIIRLERIVKIDNKNGVGVDIPVKGYVAGENGCSKIRGMVFDRAGKVARNAAIAGFMSGMADYLSSNSRQGVTFEPNSGLAQFSPQAGSKMLQQGASKGIGNAVEKYADFIIKRAEQMQPVIMIDGGRKVTIVFTESVKASAVHMKKVRRKLYAKKQF